ncbi:16851_t:CDS:2 [Funneliformis geosporum]|uniref:16851_t:CDS:1 n=1 Tax=Funneliformis geosporum TaxID=1117311 RepID=A0A9W4WMW4_9GLOM|nr:16851_t:CDS:2 [Funneliformis geosporum]
MAFQRSHPRQKRTCEEYKAELKEENYHLRSELQTEVNTNCCNEKQIRDLKCDYDRCVQEIQTLNGEIERLGNASKEEIVELNVNPFPDTLTREEIMRVIAKAYGPPPKLQKPEKLQSFRIDRLESKIDEIEGVVLAVKPLSFSSLLTRFLRRESNLSSRNVSDNLSAEETTSFLLFSPILLASVTSFSSILTFFFQPFFFEISVARRGIDDTSDTASRVCLV